MSVSSPPVAAKISKANMLQHLLEVANGKEYGWTNSSHGTNELLRGAVLQRGLTVEQLEGGPYRLYTRGESVFVECVPTGRVYEGKIDLFLAVALRAGVADPLEAK